MTEVFVLERGKDWEGHTLIGVYDNSYKARGRAEREDKRCIGNWVGDYPFGWQAYVNTYDYYKVTRMEVQ